MLSVVDTNVAVVANNGNDHPLSCVSRCVEFIQKLTQEGAILLDNDWLILKEYLKNLKSSGQPGIGDFFLKWVLTNQTNPKFCAWVKITPIDKSEFDFEEFPEDKLAKFDRSDRKFVAVALAHTDHPPIFVALDTDWWVFKKELRECGVEVKFLCTSDIQSKAQEKKRTKN